MTARGAVLRLHRWAGLLTAGFLVVAGLTGSVIAFENEIDAWLNPDLFHTTSLGEALSPSSLAERIEAQEPRIRVSRIPLLPRAGETLLVSFQPRVDPGTGEPFVLPFNQLFADPVTGRVVGTRMASRDIADCCNRHNVLRIVYRFHYTLAVPGRWGVWLMGAISLIWVIDCFLGLWLTVPRGRPLLAKWTPAWLIKRRAGGYRRNLDLHRAGGLWLWLVLLALAVSGVYLNLRSEVFRPAVALVSPLTPTFKEQFRQSPPGQEIEPSLGFDEMLARARQEAARRGWAEPPGRISYDRRRGTYEVDFRGEQFHDTAGLGAPSLYFDAASGSLIHAEVATEGSAGDIFMRMQFPLHSGQIAGLAGRIVICLAGILTVVLSVTGIVIWWRKRAARAAKTRKRAAAGLLHRARYQGSELH